MDVIAVMVAIAVMGDVRVSSNIYAAFISSNDSGKGKGRKIKGDKIKWVKITKNRLRSLKDKTRA